MPAAKTKRKPGANSGVVERKRPARTASRIQPAPSRQRYWAWLATALAALAAFEVYSPALNGPFLFDDIYLPFNLPDFPVDSLRAWLHGVRPLLMFSYWVNFRLWDLNPASYHAFNILFHAANAILVFCVVQRILWLAAVDRFKILLLAGFSAGLFLLHPIQTESVAYVASRSENFSLLLFLGAFALFLYRRSDAIQWPRAIAVVLLFGAAMLVKEHTLVLPALLLLTDYFWAPRFSFQGVRRNWRVYALMAAGGALGAVWVASVLQRAGTAGFGVKELAWHEYFFTQCRAIWVYLRMFLLPFGQNIDPDFPISRSILDHGAIAGLVALIAVTVVAWLYRRRFPIAAYGWFVFLILLAPTSSFVPIRDPFAERRLYLPMVGLLLIATEFLSRARVKPKSLVAGLVAVLVIAGALAYHRNQVYSDPVVLWTDAAKGSPRKVRPQFQLAHAYYSRGDCTNAVDHYAAAAALTPKDPGLLLDWGLAYDCLNKPAEAIARLRQAAALKPTAHIYSQMGMIYGKRGQAREAMQALDTAQQLNPGFDGTYVYKGDVLFMRGDLAGAAEQFRHALALNPRNQPAQNGLAMVQERMR